MYEDGKLAEAPISLCEVQAYAFRARMAMSELACLMQDFELASRLRTDALEFRARFLEKYSDCRKKNHRIGASTATIELVRCALPILGHCLWDGDFIG